MKNFVDRRTQIKPSIIQCTVRSLYRLETSNIAAIIPSTVWMWMPSVSLRWECWAAGFSRADGAPSRGADRTWTMPFEVLLLVEELQQQNLGHHPPAFCNVKPVCVIFKKHLSRVFSVSVFFLFLNRPPYVPCSFNYMWVSFGYLGDSLHYSSFSCTPPHREVSATHYFIFCTVA